MHRYGILGLLPLLLWALPLSGQGATDTIPRDAALRGADLPPDVAERILDFVNDPRTIHFSGRTRVPAERTITGDVAVVGGPLIVAGRIVGDVVVVNGNVVLDPDAEITGSLTVAGGAVSGLDSARVRGEIVAYSERLRVRRDGDRVVRADRRQDRSSGNDVGEGGLEKERGDRRDGRADFIVATGQSYNRVEGLPVTFGPVFETEGSNPLRLRAMAIYRTEEGLAFSPSRWGYDIRAEQFLGGSRALRVGGTVRSVVDPIEAWHLSKLENGLSTFFFHRDYRDHYEREGWSVFATAAPPGAAWSVTPEFRSEEHRSMAAGSPWTLFSNDDSWRPQPLVGEGRLNSVALRTSWDTRSDEDDPSTGWYVQGEVERAVASDLVRPEAILQTDGPFTVIVPAEHFGDFTSGTIDIRRYNRISPVSRLNLRVLAGGALTGERLPPQRQHALGGEGSLPGYSLFSRDCGARDRLVVRTSDLDEANSAPPGAASFYTSYGCDRFALLQAEYRGTFSFHVDFGSDDDDVEEEDELEEEAADEDDPNATSDDEDEDDEENEYRGNMKASFGWVLFADAGRGWTANRGRRNEDTAADVGVGVLFGRIGLYGAVPLNGDRGLNVFVRLTPRF